MSRHLIMIGDSRSMKEVASSSTHLAVTSPPYVTSQFRRGQRFEYDNYLDLIWTVFREIYRVLYPDGRFCLNIGNIYTKYYYDDEDRLYNVSIATDLIEICRSIGLRLLTTYIWNKGFNRNLGGGPLLGSYPCPSTIYNNVYFEYIYVFRKPGSRKVSRMVRRRSKLSKDEWKIYTQAIWRIESETERVKGHPCVFPLEIPRRLIKMYSFVGDTVIDPFLGSGTTTLAARILGRNSIGYEVNPKYLDLIKRRTHLQEEGLATGRDEIKIITRSAISDTLEAIKIPAGRL